MELKIKFFDELTVRELYEIVHARTEIFLLEQRIICQDFDRVDYDALHCFLWDGDRIAAYLRAYREKDGSARIGRVLSVTHGVGLGSHLMRECLPEIRARLGCSTVSVHAQKHAEGFYARHGFVPTSEDFIEEGVVHIAMENKE